MSLSLIGGAEGSLTTRDSGTGRPEDASNSDAATPTTQPRPTAVETVPSLSTVPYLLEPTAVLQGIPIELEHRGGYSRDLFAVWSDLDTDGCDTRDEVLIEESLSPAQVDPFGCKVVAGDWASSYDNVATTDPSDFDIDHVVPLKEAWDSGAWAWTPERRVAFANDLTDPRTLIAVSASSNRSKGDADPSNWLPTDSDVCRYVGDWLAIKARWGLSMDESEWGRIKNLLRDRCTTTTIAPWQP